MRPNTLPLAFIIKPEIKQAANTKMKNKMGSLFLLRMFNHWIHADW